MTILYFTLLLILFTEAIDVQDADYKFREDNEIKTYPVKRGIQTQGPYYIIPREDQEADVDYSQNRGQYRHLGDTPIHDYLNLRSDVRRYGRRSDRLRKRDLRSQVREPFGFVYSKGRLLGVLEPYTDLYQLAPLSNAREGIEEIQPLPLQSVSETRSLLTEPGEDSEKDESGQNEYARYTDEKYPMVLTDFKIDSKLNAVNAHKLDNWQSSKTDKKGKSVFDVSATDKSVGTSDDSKLVSKKEITDEKISELSSALHRIKQSDSADNVEAIEEDLRGLLSDMGLIDSELLKNKREAVKRDASNEEDENLEQGANNIEVVKATHDPDKNDRKKREGLTGTTNIDVSVGSTADEGLRSTEIKEGENEENKREATTAKVNNYQSQGEVYVRNKRHEMTTENSDLMKGLEKSGELTVSGNKSPLASSENNVKITEKRKDSYVSTSPTGVTTTGDDYEKQLEKNIQQRIEAIKEEVKREIASLQAKNTANTISEEEAQRKKRETSNTLVEKESKGLNPVEHPEGQLVPRVRTKRNLEEPGLHSRTKRGAYGDYFVDETGEEMDDPEIIENAEEDENEDYFLDTERNDSGFTNDSSITYENSTEKVFSNNTSSTRSIQPSIELNQTVSSPPVTLTSVSKQSHTGAVSDGLEDVTLKSSRKRRQVIIHTRKKRAEALVPDGNAAYLPYRAEDEEVDDEGDEFEDDGFDDRTASLNKREVNRNIPSNRYALDYSEYDEPYGTSDYQQKYPVRRYISNLNSPVYDNVPNFLHDPTAYVRRKRNNFDHLVALHGGGPMVRHLAATRERNMRQFENESRKKRNFRRTSQPTEDNKQEQQNIADLSDTDLFGALPQSYEGELSRFKRVKRKVAAVKGVG